MFKFEGGTHRVQRVPETESQGRIHTSTATVAVLPEAEDVDVQIDPNDLQIDVYRSSGPGGQSVNTTDSAVRITHKPTRHRRLDAGREVASCRTARRRCACCARGSTSAALAEQQAELAADRRSQVGTGDRAEKIRTYNYPRATASPTTASSSPRTTSTRCSAGELDEFTAALQADEKRRRLEAQAAAWPCRRVPGPRRARLGARSRSRAAGCDTPRLDAELLLAHALGVDRAR